VGLRQDVREANDSQPRKFKGEQLCGIAKSKGTKNYGGIMFIRGEGDRHYLLLEALLMYAQEDPYMIKLLGWQKYIDIVTKAPIGWIDGACISYFTYLKQGCYLVSVGA